MTPPPADQPLAALFVRPQTRAALIQALVTATGEDAGRIARVLDALAGLGCQVAPLDDPRRPFADSALPEAMVHAGLDMVEKAAADQHNYVSGVTTDWDNGMIAVAVYRAMSATNPLA